MKKALSIIFCLLGVGLVVLISSGLSRAAAPTGWKAVILPGGNLAGDSQRLDGNLGGYVYTDLENSVDVYATIGTNGGRYYRTIFHLNVNYPEKVFFSGINLIPVSSGSAATYPGFPNGNTLFTFINGPHPYDDQYTAIQFSFFGEYTTSKAMADWASMGIGDTQPMRMYVSIYSKPQGGDCVECILNDYHAIEINSLDAVLQRTGADNWTIHVNAVFDQGGGSLTYPPEYSSSEFVAERYCTCVEQIVRRKTTLAKVTNYAAWGRGAMAFDIKFVMN